MQVLDVQPTNPTPYTPVGGTYNTNPTPGAGGLPALSGLTRNVNPMAAQLQNQGRGDDSVLVHMTPNEVNSLRGLAQSFGGDLSMNPNTGLPEAGFLGKILPTLLGVGLNFLLPASGLVIGGLGTAGTAGLLTAAGTTAITGDLQKGLTAGLGAFGGASLGGALSGVGTPPVAPPPAAPVPSEIGELMPPVLGPNPTFDQAFASLGAPSGTAAVAPGAVDIASLNAPKTGIFDKFGAAAREGMKPGSFPYKAAPFAAGLGLLNTVSAATAPNMPKYEEEEGPVYEGPYRPQPRRLNPRATGPSGMGELNYFEESNPYPGYLTRTGGMPMGFAEGGSAKDVTKMSHEELIGKGYTDPTTGERSQLPAGAEVGMSAMLGGQQFIVNPARRWELFNPPAARPPSGQTGNENYASQRLMLGSDYVPASPTAATSAATSAATPVATPTTMAPVAAPTAMPTGPSPSTPSGFGVEQLGSPYRPQFQQRPDFMTPTPREATMGRGLAAQLPQYMSLFQTSPGAVTASRTYEGGSPSERIREMARMAASNATKDGSQELDYGFKKAATNPDGTSTSPTEDSIYGGYLSELAPFIQSYIQRGGMARGGEVDMRDGSFVVDARTVSELGNGSSNAGIDILERLGGKAVRGPGDGVSDSVRARIGGKQEARVARDEVIFGPEAVRKLGGAKKLYALMDKAHKARKKAGRGSDTKVAKGLGALA